MAILSARKCHWQNFSFTWMSNNGFMNSGSCAFIDLRQGRQAAPPTMWSTSNELLCQSSEQTFQNETHDVDLSPSVPLVSWIWLVTTQKHFGQLKLHCFSICWFWCSRRKNPWKMISERICTISYAEKFRSWRWRTTLVRLWTPPSQCAVQLPVVGDWDLLKHHCSWTWTGVPRAPHVPEIEIVGTRISNCTY